MSQQVARTMLNRSGSHDAFVMLFFGSYMLVVGIVLINLCVAVLLVIAAYL